MSAHGAHAMTRDEIEAAIPHRPPMLLVDEVVRRDESTISCRKTFRDDEYFFQGHYPDHPLVPGVILCEVALQAGAILLSRFEATGLPVATRLNDVRFRQMVRPGDTVEVQVELMEKLANAFFMKGKMHRDGQLVMRLEFACAAAAS